MLWAAPAPSKAVSTRMRRGCGRDALGTPTSMLEFEAAGVRCLPDVRRRDPAARAAGGTAQRSVLQPVDLPTQ